MTRDEREAEKKYIRLERLGMDETEGDPMPDQLKRAREAADDAVARIEAYERENQSNYQ